MFVCVGAGSEKPMNTVDPKLIALQFNECINRQDTHGLVRLMTDDHTFIDRKGEAARGRDVMTRGWTEFFKSFPEYRNTFHRVQSKGNRVVLLGYATWKSGGGPDRAIWTARIEDDRVAEWRIDEDTSENRKRLGLT